MKNRKGSDQAVEGIGNILMLVAISLFVLLVVYMMYSGFSTPKDEAMSSAVDIQRAINSIDSDAMQSFEVNIGESWWINFDSENETVMVHNGDELVRAYNFEFPDGYDKICCPEALASGYCSQYCPNTAIIGRDKKVNRVFCVTTKEELTAIAAGTLTFFVPGSGYLIAKLAISEDTIIIYPKSGMTCTETLAVLVGDL